MTRKIADIGKELAKYAANPAAMNRIILRELEEGGLSIVNPTDPVVFAIESAVVSGHAVMQSIDNALPKVFSSMATTVEDVYRHLSDKDALNIFALPSHTTFQIVFDVNELRGLARPIPNSEIKKLVIPVNTIYKAKDIIFSQPYPLEIRFLPHDNIQIRWDTSYDNPFTSIAPESVDFTISSLKYESAKIQALRIYIPVEQYSVRIQSANTIPNITWSETYALTDEFYACRVLHRKGGKWQEMKIGLSIETIDPVTPTCIIQPNGKSLKLTIPEIYTNSGMVSGELSIEILETKGQLSKNFANYVPGDFTYQFKDHLGATPSEYTNVLKQVSLAQVFNPDTVSGGRAPLPFEELRRRVISNTLGEIKQPLTDDELRDVLVDKGYSVFKAVDTISSRIYMAALDLPSSDIRTISGPIGCANDNVILDLEQLRTYPGVRVNGNRFTLTDECLFTQTGSNTTLFESQTLKSLNWLSNVDKIDYFKDKRLLSIPYHVVLDLNNDVVEARVYALSKPRMVSRQLETTNDNITLVVSTKTSELLMTETGYRLRCLVKCNKEYRDLDPNRLDAFLSFESTTGRVFKRGELIGAVGDDYLWEWEIDTNLDVDRKDNLIVNGFLDNNDITYDMGVGLESSFSVVYGVMGTYGPEMRTSADEYLPNSYDGIAITRESQKLHFGEALENMWVYARPVPGTLQYEKYKEDVPATYPVDVKIAKPGGGWEYDIVDGEPKFRVLHKKGDPIFEKDGSPRIRHRKGDTVYVEGKPVITDVGKVQIEVDMWLVDTRFKVTTVPEVKEYNDFWFRYIIDNSRTVIPDIAKQALDRTKLKLTARNTISRVKVMLGNEVVTTIPAEQKFSIRYYVTDNVRQDQELMKQIKMTTNRVVHNTLQGATIVSCALIAEALKDNLGDYVKGVTVNDFENANDTDYFTVLDANASIGIAKRLTLTADNNLTIEDDISITYLKYKK